MSASTKQKKDYRQLLDQESFARFSRMRAIRKKLAEEEGIPAYQIFTDEELAQLAQQEKLTSAGMRAIKGIGEKKMEKYGRLFIKITENETDQ